MTIPPFFERRTAFGRSFVFNVPALQLGLQRMPATLELAFSALLIALIIGVPLGLVAGLWAKHASRKRS